MAVQVLVAACPSVVESSVELWLDSGHYNSEAFPDR